MLKYADFLFESVNKDDLIQEVKNSIVENDITLVAYSDNFYIYFRTPEYLIMYDDREHGKISIVNEYYKDVNYYGSDSNKINDLVYEFQRYYKFKNIKNSTRSFTHFGWSIQPDYEKYWNNQIIFNPDLTYKILEYISTDEHRYHWMTKEFKENHKEFFTLKDDFDMFENKDNDYDFMKRGVYETKNKLFTKFKNKYTNYIDKFLLENNYNNKIKYIIKYVKFSYPSDEYYEIVFFSNKKYCYDMKIKGNKINVYHYSKPEYSFLDKFDNIKSAIDYIITKIITDDFEIFESRNPYKNKENEYKKNKLINLIVSGENYEVNKIDNLINEIDDLNYTNEIGYSPIFYASCLGRFNILKKLIRNGANPTIECLKCSCQKNHYEICKYLLKLLLPTNPEIAYKYVNFLTKEQKEKYKEFITLGKDFDLFD